MTTSQRNPVAVPVHEVFAARWSPYSFDPEREVEEREVRALFEAARWCMSSLNEQPWRYIVGARGRSDAVRQRILSVLMEGNQPWAERAAVLAIGLHHTHFESSDKPNRVALHDLGAASAFLTIEATARDLVVHQMAGVDREAARREFEIPDSLTVATALAIGHHDPSAEGLPENYAKRELRERTRRSVEEIVLEGAL